MVKILITGGSGYVGQHLVKELSPEYEADLATGEGLEDLPDLASYDVVVNCAAIAQPAICAENPEKAMALNVPRQLLTRLRSAGHDGNKGSSDGARRGPVLLHLSTDQVYPDHRPLWTEEDAPAPVNVYGESKLAAERCIDELWPSPLPCLILRCSLIVGPPPPFGFGKSTFVQFVESSTAAGAAGDFLTDEFRNPVLVHDIAELCRRVASGAVQPSELPYRVYNFGGPDRLSRYDIAREVARQLGRDPALCLKPRTTAEVPPRPFRSPLDISMDSGRLTRTLGLQPTSFAEAVCRSLLP